MPAPHYSVFTGRMPFLLPNQQHQSIEGKITETPGELLNWNCGITKFYNVRYKENAVVLTPESSKTMQVIRRVFQVSMSAIMVFHAVYNNCLKPSPAHRYDERVICLQFTIIPPMMF